MIQPLLIIKKTAYSLLALGLLLAFSQQPINAQAKQQVSIAASPSRIELDLKKGSKQNGSFTVYNTGNTNIKVKFYAKDYTFTNDNHSLGSNNQTLISKWINFNVDNADIKIGESVEVVYTVDVPTDIPDGGQYGIIVSEIDNQSTNKRNDTISDVKLKVIIYAKTDGKNIIKGEFVKSKIPFLHIRDKFNFTFNVKNNGNTHFKLKDTKVKVTSLFGKNKFEYERPEIIITPNITKKIDLESNALPLFGLFKVNLSSSLLDQKLEQTKTILIISPSLLIILAIVMLVLGIIYIANKKAKRKARPSVAN